MNSYDGNQGLHYKYSYINFDANNIVQLILIIALRWIYLYITEFTVYNVNI